MGNKKTRRSTAAGPGRVKTAELVAVCLVALLAGDRAADATVTDTIELASQMDAGGFMSEDVVTGAYARINLGDGLLGSVGARSGDADGFYLLDGSQAGTGTPSQLGTDVDLFPREADFVVGNLTFDTTGITGLGVETSSVLSIDLGELWTDDPNRTSGSATANPTVLSDISDHAIGLWLFDQDGVMAFGTLDANDTVTFTDGLLTSIDLAIDLTFTAFGGDAVWSETDGFRIEGDQISLQLTDTSSFNFSLDFTSEFQIDLVGTVQSVGVFVVPEPAAGLVVAGLAVLPGRRNRSDRSGPAGRCRPALSRGIGFARGPARPGVNEREVQLGVAALHGHRVVGAHPAE